MMLFFCVLVSQMLKKLIIGRILNQCFHTSYQNINPWMLYLHTHAVVDNWKAWLDKECQLWNHTSEFVANLCPFQWPLPLQSSQHPLSVTFSERHDIPKTMLSWKAHKLSVQRDIILNKSILLETEVISGLCCIYRWEDQDNEGAEYLWLGYVVSVEGSPVECQKTLQSQQSAPGVS